MGMTITEKILARAAGHEDGEPGQLIDAKIDVVMCHDVTTPPAISMLAEAGTGSGLRPGQDRRHARPLPAGQGHRQRRAAQAPGRMGQAPQDHILLQGRPGRRLSRPAARAGPHPARRGDRGRRLAHLHLRGASRRSPRASGPRIWPRPSPRASCGSRCRRR